MIFTGIGDEAGDKLETQISATLDAGWKHLEMRGLQVGSYDRANLHDIPDPAFETVVRQFDQAGVSVYCFGSTIMNWARRISDPFELTIAEVQRAIPRMQRLGTRFVRIMSYKPEDEEFRIPPEVFRRVREVTSRFIDAGLQPVHENCMNFGGMSWQHALELLDRCPGLKWAFDTANPIFNPDRSKSRPWPRQDPWEFWINLREHTVHIHVKDAKWNSSRNDADYVWPGEGQGRVVDILQDAIKRGYQGALSIEPHMVTVFHDDKSSGQTGPDSRSQLEMAKRKNYVEYARVLQELVANLSRTALIGPQPT